MASRQQEKERRRQERIAAEQAAAAARSRRNRLQAALAAVVVVAAVAGGVVAITGGKSSGKENPPPTKPAAGGAAIPAAQEKDLAKAAAAAHCVVLNPPIEGRTHVSGKVNYGTNPPSSGNHNPIPALDGIYSPGNTPSPEHYVHTLEHGRVEVQYKPGTPKHRIAQLETLVSEPLHGKAAYKALLFENNTHMSYAVAATAWGHIIGCPTFNDRVFDAIRDFRLKFVDLAPESASQPPNN